MMPKYNRITTNYLSGKQFIKNYFPFLLILILLAFISCAPRYDIESHSIGNGTMDNTTHSLPQIYFYAKDGQSTEQQSRDHYECYNWAVNQTDFDPSQSPLPTEERIKVVPVPPPGHDTITMSIIGAVMGALIAGPRHAAGGAIIGATGGALAGIASDASRMEYARQQEDAYAAGNRALNAQAERKALEFQRAMSACLEGRGYSVR
ncbi:MAG: glycine zipper family protein [Proteobacteria bacterium]|nr:glycine zipper family protein [Pseudomonadota bacterium]MBU4035419.1 glycine zipper family protein [Pseudomonadota bacterium]